jgi:hypothetical protein
MGHLQRALRKGVIAERVKQLRKAVDAVHAGLTERNAVEPDNEAVGAIRVGAASRRLEEPEERIESVAEDSGFSREEQMRCAFIRIMGIPPREWRKRFATIDRLASCCRRTILAAWPTCLNPLPAVAPSAVAVPGPFSVESCASASVSPILLEGVKRRCGFIRYAQRTSGPRRSLKRLRGLRMGCLIGRRLSVRHAGAWHINGSSVSTGLNDLRPGRPSVAVAMNLSLRGVGVFALCFMRRGGLLLGDTCISGVARLTLRRARSWNRFCSSART